MEGREEEEGATSSRENGGEADAVLAHPDASPPAASTSGQLQQRSSDSSSSAPTESDDDDDDDDSLFFRDAAPARLSNDGEEKESPSFYPLDHPRGYWVVLGAFLVQFLNFGMKSAFSVFVVAMTHKQGGLGEPSKQELSLVASLAAGPGMVLGIIGGYLLDWAGPKPLLAFLTLLLVFALVASSYLAHSFIDLLLLYSLPFTFFNGFSDSPISAAVGSWFAKKLSIAMGVAAIGGALGSAVIPLVAGWLLEKHHNDWRPCWRYLALFDVLMLLATALCSMRPKMGAATTANRSNDVAGLPRGTSQHIATAACCADGSTRGGEGAPAADDRCEDGIISRGGGDSPAGGGGGHGRPSLRMALQLMRTKSFVILFIAGYFFALTYASTLFIGMPLALSYGKAAGAARYADDGPSIPTEKASTLYTFFGVSQAAGALTAGLAGYVCCQRLVYAGSAAVAALACLFIALSTSYQELAIGYCLVGFGLAGTRSMYPSLLTQRFNGDQLGTVMGVGFISNGLGAISGPPLVSWFRNLSGPGVGSYVSSLVFMASSILVSGWMVMFILPKAPRVYAPASLTAILLAAAASVGGAGSDGDDQTPRHSNSTGSKGHHSYSSFGSRGKLSALTSTDFVLDEPEDDDSVDGGDPVTSSSGKEVVNERRKTGTAASVKSVGLRRSGTSETLDSANGMPCHEKKRSGGVYSVVSSLTPSEMGEGENQSSPLAASGGGQRQPRTTRTNRGATASRRRQRRGEQTHKRSVVDDDCCTASSEEEDDQRGLGEERSLLFRSSHQPSPPPPPSATVSSIAAAAQRNSKGMYQYF